MNAFKSRPAQHIVQPNGPIGNEKEANVAESDRDSDSLSLEARNEKEVQQRPDQVTAGAQIGQQKAEAAALVWSKKAVYATYAW